MNTELINKVEKYCKKLLNNGRCSQLQFHNYQHTLDVAQNANLIAQKLNLSDEDREMVVVSAYFHDVGNMETTNGHEKLSCKIAREFLTKENFPEDKIEIVEHTILSTEMGREPTTLLEEIICDADLGHLGKKTFLTQNRLLREEWSNFLGMTFTDEEWVALNIRFLNSHNFHTAIGREIFDAKKKENLLLLKDAF